MKLDRSHLSTSERQFVRYLIASVAAFGVDCGLLYLCTQWLSMHYVLSATLGFTIGAALNYMLCITWVFFERNITSPAAEFGFFVAIGVCGLVINLVSLWVLTDVAGFHYLVSKLTATGWVFLFNFFTRKFLLFTRRALIKTPIITEPELQHTVL